MIKPHWIALFGLVFGINLIATPAGADTLPTFTTKNLTFLKRTPGRRGNPYHESLSSSLRKADSSIVTYQYLVLGQSYDESLQSLLNILKKKALKGVRVQFYLSESRKDPMGNPLNAKVKDYFGTAPVSVKLLSDEISMHSKVVLIDTNIAFVGSQNWTPAGLRKNIGTAVKVQEERFVSELRKRLRESVKNIWLEDSDREESSADNQEESQELQPNSLDFDTVTEQQLERIPGIGPAYAKRIIQYREENRFVKVEDLEEVKGIGGSRLRTLEKYFKD